MVVGILQLELRLPAVHSLKEKRWILKSLMTRVRNRFNVSISEVDSHDSWQRSLIAAAHVSNEQGHTNQLLDRVLNFVEKEKQLEVLRFQIDFF